MNKRQKKKLYKKLCDKYNIPYSSYPKNRENKTMNKRETEMVSQMLLNFKDIIKVYTNLGISLYKPEAAIVHDIDDKSMYQCMTEPIMLVPTEYMSIVNL